MTGVYCDKIAAAKISRFHVKLCIDLNVSTFGLTSLTTKSKGLSQLGTQTRVGGFQLPSPSYVLETVQNKSISHNQLLIKSL